MDTLFSVPGYEHSLTCAWLKVPTHSSLVITKTMGTQLQVSGYGYLLAMVWSRIAIRHPLDIDTHSPLLITIIHWSSYGHEHPLATAETLAFARLCLNMGIRLSLF